MAGKPGRIRAHGRKSVKDQIEESIGRSSVEHAFTKKPREAIEYLGSGRPLHGIEPDISGVLREMTRGRDKTLIHTHVHGDGATPSNKDIRGSILRFVKYFERDPLGSKASVIALNRRRAERIGTGNIESVSEISGYVVLRPTKRFAKTVKWHWLTGLLSRHPAEESIYSRYQKAAGEQPSFSELQRVLEKIGITIRTVPMPGFKFDEKGETFVPE